MFGSTTDDSARVVNQARDAVSQGRIADALEAVEQGRHDVRLDDVRRVSLFLSGLLAKLALGDLRGGAAYARELTNLMRIRGVVGATASFGLGEFAAARGNSDQAVSYYERAGQELTAARSRAWLPWRSGLARVIAGRGEIARAATLVEAELAEARAAQSAYATSYALRTYAAIAPTGDRLGLLDEALELLQGIGRRPARGPDPHRPRRLDPAAPAAPVAAGGRPAARRREVRPARGARAAPRPHPVAARAPRRGARRRAPGSAGRAQRRRAARRPADRRGQAQPRDRRRARGQREVRRVARLPHPAQDLHHLPHRARRRPGPAPPSPLTTRRPLPRRSGHFLRAEVGLRRARRSGEFSGAEVAVLRASLRPPSDVARRLPFGARRPATSARENCHLGRARSAHLGRVWVRRGVATYVVSRYSSMPSKPPSRPKPLAFTPPNGAAGLDSRPVLTPTMPNSSASATLIVRARSRV